MAGKGAVGSGVDGGRGLPRLPPGGPRAPGRGAGDDAVVGGRLALGPGRSLRAGARGLQDRAARGGADRRVRGARAGAARRALGGPHLLGRLPAEGSGRVPPRLILSRRPEPRPVRRGLRGGRRVHPGEGDRGPAPGGHRLSALRGRSRLCLSLLAAVLRPVHVAGARVRARGRRAAPRGTGRGRGRGGGGVLDRRSRVRARRGGGGGAPGGVPASALQPAALRDVADDRRAPAGHAHDRRRALPREAAGRETTGGGVRAPDPGRLPHLHLEPLQPVPLHPVPRRARATARGGAAGDAGRGRRRHRALALRLLHARVPVRDPARPGGGWRPGDAGQRRPRTFRSAGRVRQGSPVLRLGIPRPGRGRVAARAPGRGQRRAPRALRLRPGLRVPDAPARPRRRPLPRPEGDHVRGPAGGGGGGGQPGQPCPPRPSGAGRGRAGRGRPVGVQRGAVSLLFQDLRRRRDDTAKSAAPSGADRAAARH